MGRLIKTVLMLSVLGALSGYLVRNGRAGEFVGRLMAAPSMVYVGSAHVQPQQVGELLGTPSWTWWLPGAGWQLERKVLNRFEAIGAIHLERQWKKQTISLMLIERKPIARWKTADGTRGIDGESRNFPVTSEAAEGLPWVNARFIPENFGPWLESLSTRRISWRDQIHGFAFDDAARMTIHLKGGGTYQWGPLDDSAAAKFALLEKVLEDISSRFGAAQNINLTLWNEGRIVVLPIGKGIKGEPHGQPR